MVNPGNCQLENQTSCWDYISLGCILSVSLYVFTQNSNINSQFPLITYIIPYFHVQNMLIGTQRIHITYACLPKPQPYNARSEPPLWHTHALLACKAMNCVYVCVCVSDYGIILYHKRQGVKYISVYTLCLFKYFLLERRMRILTGRREASYLLLKSPLPSTNIGFKQP